MSEAKKPKWNKLPDMSDAEKVTFLMERSYKFLKRIEDLESIIAQLNCAPGLIDQKLQRETKEAQSAYSKIKHKHDILLQQSESIKKEVEVLRGLIKTAEGFIPGIIDKVRWQRACKSAFKVGG